VQSKASNFLRQSVTKITSYSYTLPHNTTTTRADNVSYRLSSTHQPLTQAQSHHCIISYTYLCIYVYISAGTHCTTKSRADSHNSTTLFCEKKSTVVIKYHITISPSLRQRVVDLHCDLDTGAYCWAAFNLALRLSGISGGGGRGRRK
jgi:hypothetical protein